ncbi:MAG: alpha-amylase family glycosyl hydrolase [Verrucomicrobiota bacterium]
MKGAAAAGVLLLAAGTVCAQSTRPGWGSVPYHDNSGTGVTFRVWAPNVTSVSVPGQFNSWSTTANPLAKEYTNSNWTGVWSADIATASSGQQYKIYINGPAGGVWRHDPRSRLVTYSGSSAGANDIILDPSAFNWSGDAAVSPALKDLFIYELHIGTFSTSQPNRFLAATNRLDYLKSLGVNAVELMPIAEFPGDNSWGYNPAQLFAVENTGFGGPTAFKVFVKACHDRGIAVLLDVVHNHYGPSDLDMWNFDGYSGTGLGGGIYFNQANSYLQQTPYGDTRPNFNSAQVCSFVQDNFNLWLDEYHVDGFRWDTPGLMMNADNYGYIASAGTLINNINSMIHTSYPGKISISEDVYNSFGFDSAWDTSYPGTFTPVLAAASDSSRNMGTVANAILYNVRYGGFASPARVAFLESHDVVGDLNGGTRLVTAIDSATPSSYKARKLSTLGSAVTLMAPGIPMIFQGQEMLENQQFSSSRAVDWTKTNTYSYIVQFYRDLIGLRRDLKGYTPGLKGDTCALLLVDNTAKLVAFHRYLSSAPARDAMVVANFSAVPITRLIAFPFAGTWYSHLNSDSTVYGADYSNTGSTSVTATGSPASGSVTIGPYSVLVLSPTPDAPPTLNITPSGASVIVSWPAAYSEWGLEQSPSLVSGSWTAVPTGQYQSDGTTVTVTVNASDAASYYRLRTGF